MQHLPQLVVLLTVALMFFTMMRCGRARMRYGIKAPATTGHPAFERAYRVQMNTLEQSVLFLPTLYLAATYTSAKWAGLLGLIWLIARFWYVVAYQKSPRSRGMPFMLGGLAWALLFLLALAGILRLLVA